MERTAIRPLLILDLDETLIHGAEERLDRDADFRVGPFHVYKRPDLDHFLQKASSLFDLAIWSSASADYVQQIAAELSPCVAKWQFVWSRDRCVQRMHPEYLQPYFVKDLKKVQRKGYDLDRVLIVDDTPLKVSRHYGNAIYIRPFEGASDDSELSRLGRYLDSIHCAANFRTIEKRGWRTISPSS